jgi:hypothetical protein
MPTATRNSRSEIAYRREALRAHIIKCAELGGDGQDQPFEQAFASLAHAYLKDRAPGLLDYEVGFQLLDRNEDNSKAIGVRGFKVGSQLLFAPVFFIDGDLKGHELLYIKNDDQFVPLKENWINYLLQKKPLSMGEGIHKDTRRVGVRAPWLSRLAHSPSTFGASKYASTMPGWVQEGMPALAYAATTNPYTDVRYKGMRGMPELLKEGGIRTVRSLLKYAQAYPGIARGLDQFYDLNTVQGLLAELKREKTAAAVTSVLSGLDVAPRRAVPGWARGSSVLGDTEPYNPIKMGSLQVYTYDRGNLMKPTMSITEEDTEKLLRDAILIKDERKQDEGISHAFNVRTKHALSNPSQTGLYDIMVKPDVFEKMIVLIGPHGTVGRKIFCTVARAEGDTKGWINIHPSYVWASKQYSDEDWKTWAGGLPNASTLTGDSDGQYIIVGHDKADGTLPFLITGTVGDPDGYKILNVHFDLFSGRPRPAAMRGVTLWSFYESKITDNSENYDRWSDGERIHVGGRVGAEVRSKLGDVFIPEGWRVLKVEEADYDDDQWDPPKEDVTTKLFRPLKSLTGGKGESKTPPISPAQLIDIEMGLWQQKTGSTIPHDRMRVSFTGSSATIDGGPYLTEKQAIVQLVRDRGFRENAARAMLKMAYENRFKKGGPTQEFRVLYAPWVKQAAPPNPLLDSAPTAPGIPDPRYASNSFMNENQYTQEPQEDSILVDGMKPDPNNRELYRPNIDPDPHAAHAATEAAASGQREIFDTSILGGLLKTTRDDQLTDRYLGDLMKGMDRVGRILFQLYWHRDSFEERYGKSHIPELEDMLRNSFEDLGDLVLDLKQKTVEADPGSAGQRIDFKSDTND